MSGLALVPTRPLASGCWEALYPGIKQLGCEVDHSAPSSTKAKNAWSYTTTPHMSLWCGGALLSIGNIFRAWYLVKHRYNFTFTSWDS